MGRANESQDGVRMGGVLVREGGGGEGHVVQALELGALHPKRTPGDLLPFLPQFRQLMASLPRDSADLDLRVKSIPLENVECVTNTVIKLDGSPWYLRVKKGNSYRMTA